MLVLAARGFTLTGLLLLLLKHWHKLQIRLFCRSLGPLLSLLLLLLLLQQQQRPLAVLRVTLVPAMSLGPPPLLFWRQWELLRTKPSSAVLPLEKWGRAGCGRSAAVMLLLLRRAKGAMLSMKCSAGGKTAV